jgi:hypothetical protein
MLRYPVAIQWRHAFAPPVVEPVDPLQSRQLDLVEPAPQGSRRRVNSVSNRSISDSAAAFSQESATEPTEPTGPIPATRSVYRKT